MILIYFSLIFCAISAKSYLLNQILLQFTLWTFLLNFFHFRFLFLFFLKLILNTDTIFAKSKLLGNIFFGKKTLTTSCSY